MRSEGLNRVPRLALLAALPMLGALAGGWLDQRHHLGFTTWRSACRAAGLRLSSLVEFTWQLLPSALVGLLLGGLVVLGLGALATRHGRPADDCLAAHVGCALTLPAGLWICASAVPLPLMLLADVAAAAVLALLLAPWLRRGSRRRFAHP